MWFEIKNTQEVNTPCLAVYPDRIRQNIESMKSLVGTPKRLCPHIKTHKSLHILELYSNAGVTQFKCANLAELALVARSKADYALHAMQCVGPQVNALVNLVIENPHCTFGTLIDNPVSLRELSDCASQHGIDVDVFVDLNNGMNRTGIRPNTEEALELYAKIEQFSGVRAGGLHVYDGHIHDHESDIREARVSEAMIDVLELRDRIVAAGLPMPKLFAGGTPSFPIHAQHDDRVCCPGTPALWDAGYTNMFPDLQFLPAAVLLTRVISCLGNDLYCLDLGYKSIAAEMRPPRAKFLNAPVTEEVSHSEEHLVVQLDRARSDSLRVGDVVYALPWHICPTVARHDELLVVEGDSVVDRWTVDARDRRLPV